MLRIRELARSEGKAKTKPSEGVTPWKALKEVESDLYKGGIFRTDIGDATRMDSTQVAETLYKVGRYDKIRPYLFTIAKGLDDIQNDLGSFGNESSLASLSHILREVAGKLDEIEYQTVIKKIVSDLADKVITPGEALGTALRRAYYHNVRRPDIVPLKGYVGEGNSTIKDWGRKLVGGDVTSLRGLAHDDPHDLFASRLREIRDDIVSHDPVQGAEIDKFLNEIGIDTPTPNTS